MAQIRGVFRKTIIDTSSRVDFWPVKCVFTPIFRLHTVATARDLLTYGYSLLTYPALIEIYPLVSFLPSEDVGFSGYMLTLLLWTPLTGAQASTQSARTLQEYLRSERETRKVETLIKICNIHNYKVLCVHSNKLLIELRHSETGSQMLKQIESGIAEYDGSKMNIELDQAYKEGYPDVAN